MYVDCFMRLIIMMFMRFTIIVLKNFADSHFNFNCNSLQLHLASEITLLETQLPGLIKKVTLKRAWLALSNTEGVVEGVTTETLKNEETGEDETKETEVRIPRVEVLSGEIIITYL